MAVALPDLRPRLGARAGAAFGLGLLLILVFSNAWQLFVLGPDGDPSASALARALYVPGYAAAIALIVLNPKDSLRATLRSGVLLLLLTFALASALWSADSELTLRRSVALILTTAGGLGLAAAFEWAALAGLLAAAFLILGLASLLTGMLLPDLGRMTTLFPGAWRGVWLEKNALGDHMALGLVISLAAARLDRRRRGAWLLGAALAFGLVLLSTSKTSLAALAPALGAMGLLELFRRGPALKTLGVYLGVVLALGGALLVLLFWEPLLSLLGKDETLTGRTRLWSAILTEADQRPLFGWGYGAVWRTDDPFGPLAWITKDAKFLAFEAHDTWLSVRLDLGLIGLGLFALYVVETWWRALRAVFGSEGAVLVLPVLTFLSVLQITETAALDYNNFVWTIFAALSFSLVLETERRATPGPDRRRLETRRA